MPGKARPPIPAMSLTQSVSSPAIPQITLFCNTCFAYDADAEV